jgi:outer membrane protein
MSNTRIALVAAIALTLAMSAAADAPLTIEDAVVTALANNRGLLRDHIDLEALRRSADNAWNTLVPSVTASAGIVRANEITTGDDGDKTSLMGAAELSLLFSPGMSTRIRSAKLDYRAGGLSYSTARRKLELDVRLAFYKLLLAEENVHLAEQNIARAQVRYDQIAARHKAGLAPDLDLLSARVSLEKLKPQAESARTRLANGLASFRTLLGLDPDLPVTLSGSLEVSSADKAGSAFAEGDSVDAARLGIELGSARASKRTAELESFAPSFSLALSTQPTRTDPLGSGTRIDQGSVQLGVSLPLDNYLPRSAARDRIASADDAVRKLESRLADSREQTQTTVASSRRTIQTALRLVEAQRLNVQLAQQTYDLIQDAYSKGLKDLLDLQSAAGDLESARVAVLSSSYDLVAALLELEYALDLPFGSLWR